MRVTHTSCRILLLSDDTAALWRLRRQLNRQDPHHEIVPLTSRADALAAQAVNPFDIVFCGGRFAKDDSDLLAGLRKISRHSVLVHLLSADVAPGIGPGNGPGTETSTDGGCLHDLVCRGDDPDDVIRASDVAMTLVAQARAVEEGVIGTKAVDRLSVPILLVDRDARLLFRNTQSRLCEAEGLYFRVGDSGQIMPGTLESGRSLAEALQRFESLPHEQDDIGVLRGMSPDGMTPYVAFLAIHAATEWNRTFFSLAFAGQEILSTDARSIRAALNLSVSESRLVRGLVEHGGLQDGAEAAGLSINTARSYLRSIFAKTGVRSQVELVRLVMKMAVPLWIREGQRQA